MNPKVDEYLSKAEKWREELAQLRMIALECGLGEELKWRSPCYTYGKKNVFMIDGLKDCCIVGFFKGALLSDAEGILSKPGENSQAMRYIRFRNVDEIADLEPVLKAYFHEAVEIEKAGLKVEFKVPEKSSIPEEFARKLDAIPALKTAFEALTPGRQREYILYFSEAKQSRTREARVEKYIPMILNGEGMGDHYLAKKRSGKK